jgi:hypothetical protein
MSAASCGSLRLQKHSHLYQVAEASDLCYGVCVPIFVGTLCIMRKIGLLLAVAATVGVANAQQINLDPGTGLTLFTTNSNDGYSSARGMLFTMNNTIQVNSFGFYTTNAAGSATWTLRQVFTLSGNVNTGSNLITTVNTTLGSGGPQYFDAAVSPLTLTAGNSYHLEIQYSQSAAENYFYNWNGPAVNLGLLSVVDGTMGGDTGNSVAPGMRINQVVPEPASIAALALGLGVLVRRRRRA